MKTVALSQWPSAYYVPFAQQNGIAKILPSEAREQLIAASKVQGEKARLVAIDAAIDQIKLRFPEFFHQPAIKE